MKSKMEVATEVKGANAMKSVMEVRAEWICKERSNWKEISVSSKIWNDIFDGKNWNDIYKKVASEIKSVI